MNRANGTLVLTPHPTTNAANRRPSQMRTAFTKIRRAIAEYGKNIVCLSCTGDGPCARVVLAMVCPRLDVFVRQIREAGDGENATR